MANTPNCTSYVSDTYMDYNGPCLTGAPAPAVAAVTMYLPGSGRRWQPIRM
jgi:hypothetical protein